MDRGILIMDRIVSEYCSQRTSLREYLLSYKIQSVITARAFDTYDLQFFLSASNFISGFDRYTH